MQRGLRINGKTSQELWIQYFALELHYVVKLMGRKEILEGVNNIVDSNDEENANETTNTMLLPCRIIYKNAIKSIPDSLSFRLRFVETCRMFPGTRELEHHVIESIEEDFGESEEAWVSRICFAEEQMKKKREKMMGGDDNKVGEQGFLAVPLDDGDEDEEPVAKKRRLIVQDTALQLVNEALLAVPTAKMYLECARYLQLRIRRLAKSHRSGTESDDDDEQSDDVSYLMNSEKDVDLAVQRHVKLLQELYSQAEASNVHSSSLTLDRVDFLANNDERKKAEGILEQAVNTGDTSVKIFLRWANLSREMANQGSVPKLTSVSILQKGLDVTPIHKRDEFLLLSTELMKQLMSQPRNAKVTNELKSVFQKLLLTSQGLSMPGISQTDNEFEVEVNLAEIFLAYLQYTIPKGKCTPSDNEVVRSIYNDVIFHSNFAKSCLGKSNDELLAFKSFFDTCLQFEKTMAAVPEGVSKKNTKKQKKQALSKLYERAIAFFGSGGSDSVLRSVLDSYQREFDKTKLGI
jgi:hypothetical protein